MKLILHAADAAACDATSIVMCLPDTDVILGYQPDICVETQTLSQTRERSDEYRTSQVYDALGTEQAAALPALYALSGSDNTNSFAGKGKHSFWEAFQSANAERFHFHSTSLSLHNPPNSMTALRSN